MIGLNITMERIKSGIELVANHTNYTAGWTVEAYVNNTERTTNYMYGRQVNRHIKIQVDPHGSTFLLARAKEGVGEVVVLAAGMVSVSVE